MKSFLQEFRAFAVKGNVVDLAAAVIIGTAFGKIVSSLVDTVIMPSVGLLLGGIDFTSWSVTVRNATIEYGRFMQAVVDFVLIAFILFLAIRMLHRLQKREEEQKLNPLPSEEVLLLREIRDGLRK